MITAMLCSYLQRDNERLEDINLTSCTEAQGVPVRAPNEALISDGGRANKDEQQANDLTARSALSLDFQR